MIKIPELTPTQELEVYAELKKKHRNLTRAQFDQLLSGQDPFAGKESGKESNSDVEECVSIAKELRDGAIEAAKEIGNPIGRAAAILGAHLAFMLARISCLDDHGD